MLKVMQSKTTQTKRPLQSRRRKRDGLTSQRRLFCKHYLINGFVGSKAYRSAGFEEKHADVNASKLLKDPRVKAYLKKRMEKIEKKLDITFEKKIELLWNAAQRCYGPTDDEIKRLKQGEAFKPFFQFEPTALISTVAELNKMQGHYAQAKPPDDPETSPEKLEEEIKKHEREC